MLIDQVPPEAGTHPAARPRHRNGTRQMRVTVEPLAQLAENIRQFVRRSEGNVAEEVVLDPLAGGRKQLRAGLEVPIDGSLGHLCPLGYRGHGNVVGRLVLQRLDKSRDDALPRHLGIFVAKTGDMSLRCTHVISLTSDELERQAES